MSRVAVLIPTWNRARFVTEALNSVWYQTRQPDRIVIYDDASTDGTLAEITAWMKTIPRWALERIIVIHGRVNRGTGAARKELASWFCSSTCDYAFWQDSDDLSREDRIEKQLPLLEAGADAVFSNLHVFHGVQTSRTVREIRPDLWVPGDLDSLTRGGIANPTTAMNLSAAQLWQDLPGLRWGDEDVLWHFALLCSGLKWDHVPEPLVYLRKHSGRITLARRSDKNARLRAKDQAVFDQEIEKLKRKVLG